LRAKRELARRLGAPHAVYPAGEIGPVDVAFEAAGIAAVAEQAFRATRTGGKTVLIGQPALGVHASFPVYELTQFEHDVLGTHIGGAVPALDIPAIARLLQAGLLDLDPLVTHRFRLVDVGQSGLEQSRRPRSVER